MDNVITEGVPNKQIRNNKKIIKYNKINKRLWKKIVIQYNLSMVFCSLTKNQNPISFIRWTMCSV